MAEPDEEQLPTPAYVHKVELCHQSAFTHGSALKRSTHIMRHHLALKLCELFYTAEKLKKPHTVANSKDENTNKCTHELLTEGPSRS
jgi:phosphoribosylaminoimidazole-succinocarboxamide synthase